MTHSMSVDELATLVLRERSHGNFDYKTDGLDGVAYEYAGLFSVKVESIIASMKAKKKGKPAPPS